MKSLNAKSFLIYNYLIIRRYFNNPMEWANDKHKLIHFTDYFIFSFHLPYGTINRYSWYSADENLIAAQRKTLGKCVLHFLPHRPSFVTRVRARLQRCDLKRFACNELVDKFRSNFIPFLPFLFLLFPSVSNSPVQIFPNFTPMVNYFIFFFPLSLCFSLEIDD